MKAEQYTLFVVKKVRYCLIQEVGFVGRDALSLLVDAVMCIDKEWSLFIGKQLEIKPTNCPAF